MCLVCLVTVAPVQHAVTGMAPGSVLFGAALRICQEHLEHDMATVALNLLTSVQEGEAMH